MTAAPPVAAPDPTLAQTLRRLELTITRKLDGILHGQHQGLTPGHGSEIGESRPYAVGDDVRRIDWNVTARTQELHVRDLIADRDLEAWLAVDVSASMAFGTDAAEKREVALGAAAAVGFLTARAQNKVGCVVGTGAGRRAFPPRTGRDPLRALLTGIGEAARTADGSGRTDLGALLDDLGGRARRRGFVCVISDFLAPPEQWRRSIGGVAMRHETLAIEIIDRREMELPAVGLLTVTDPATGRTREVQLNAAVRDRYREAALEQRELTRSTLSAAGVQHLQLTTDGLWLEALVQYVHRRRHLANRPYNAAGARR